MQFMQDFLRLYVTWTFIVDETLKIVCDLNSW